MNSAWMNRWYCASVFVIIMTAVALYIHYPGHLSMDSSLQIEEARTGESVSWAPPFMSALLRWLGGGPVSTALFVALNAALTYAAFSLVAMSGDVAAPAGSRAGYKRFIVRFLIVVLILNPIIFMYVGIIWKDVLFASLVGFGMAVMLAASAMGSTSRVVWLLPALTLLPAVLTRQHGIFVVPILLIPCVEALARGKDQSSAMVLSVRRAMIAAAFVGAFLLLRLVVLSTIVSGNGKDMSVGFISIPQYDLTGMMAAGLDQAELPLAMQDQEFASTAIAKYSPDRIDFVLNEPQVTAGFAKMSRKEVQQTWISAIKHNPGLYAKVKLEQYAWLLGFHRLDKCLPIHVGVDGNMEYLERSEFKPGTDRFDGEIFQASMLTRHLALYRHWFYLAIFLVAVVALYARRGRMNRMERVSALCAATVIAALYASFIPTNLACDFRYLYPGIVMVTVFSIYALVVFNRPIKNTRVGEAKWPN